MVLTDGKGNGYVLAIDGEGNTIAEAVDGSSVVMDSGGNIIAAGDAERQRGAHRWGGQCHRC